MAILLKLNMISEFENQYFRYKEILKNTEKLQFKTIYYRNYDLAVDKSILNNIKKIIGKYYIGLLHFLQKHLGRKIVSFIKIIILAATATKVVTAWIALTTSSKNRELQAVPRSHGLGLLINWM